MMTVEVPLADMAKRTNERPADEPGEKADRGPRTPLKLDDDAREKLREIALIWLRDAVEVVGGEMMSELVRQQHSRGRDAIVKEFVRRHPERARKNRLAPATQGERS